MKNKKWFSDCYRRNLVDMHIGDWDETFLSKFNPEGYVANLKRAHIQAPMIYLQSHAGHCYWPTEVGHVHNAFKTHPDMTKRLIDLCHAKGMHVVGYYSLIFNTYERDNHPEWRMIDRWEGTPGQSVSRVGLCCPNNPEYRAFVRAQIAEIAAYFDVDGMFYDMTFWPTTCLCDHCKARFLEETGRKELPDGRLPHEDWNSAEWLEFQKYRIKWIGDFAKFVTETTHELMPGVSVEHNYANAVAGNAYVCSTELVNEQCDYTGGDLYGDLYNHSFTAKYYYAITKNQPFEYMTCRCDHDLSVHTVGKTEEQLACEVMLTAAHHGASFIIDGIDPVGTLDSRVYDRIGKVFERQMPYEKYFRGNMVCDVGVYFSTTGKYNSRGYDFDNKTCSVAACRTLIEENVPVGVVANSITDTLSQYKLVIASAIAGISDKNRCDLLNYVKNGGMLYVSGDEDKELLRMLLGAEFSRYTEESAVYMAPTPEGQQYFGEFNPAYPFPTGLSLPVFAFKDVDVLATMTLPYTKPNEKRFASIWTDPPGIRTNIPALVAKKLGKGKVVWSAAPIENDARRAYKKLFMSVLRGCVDFGAVTVVSNAPRQVELVTFRDKNETLVSAVDLLCTDELLSVPDFTVKIKRDKPEKVVCIGGKGKDDCEIPFSYKNGYVEFRVKKLVMFAMFRIL
ncbi:MAG: alpha-L-fucosidase [Clostridiales bacterium]|nr:alpha-L-fucosidase [Clostridiales bacterium]